MKMQTNFGLMDELMVAPTRGLDVVRGMVRIVAVTVFEGLPSDVETLQLERRGKPQKFIYGSCWV